MSIEQGSLWYQGWDQEPSEPAEEPSDFEDEEYADLALMTLEELQGLILPGDVD